MMINPDFEELRRKLIPQDFAALFGDISKFDFSEVSVILKVKPLGTSWRPDDPCTDFPRSVTRTWPPSLMARFFLLNGIFRKILHPTRRISPVLHLWSPSYYTPTDAGYSMSDMLSGKQTRREQAFIEYQILIFSTQIHCRTWKTQALGYIEC